MISSNLSPEPSMERDTICFPHHGTTDVLRRGDVGFKAEIDRLYRPEENNAIEAMILLKEKLRTLPTDDFLGVLTESMSHILGAEICFIMKRILVDDQESAVEMPPHGAPGSCVMAAALHYCASDGTRSTVKATKFHAYGCPCAYMRHDKVFLIADRLNDFITNNPNHLETPCEAYIAVPLFSDGKCFAHFGAMWSEAAAANRKLSWAFIEMFLHSLEDMICQRLLEGSNFIRPKDERSRVIPHDAVTVAQSLRPYAGSLSHELRTPMQGVVGMLDVMYATVQEACDSQSDPRLKKLFDSLKENIETVQDSSRRAVEAADNVVHAYDMDMSVPDVPLQLLDDINDLNTAAAAVKPEQRPDIVVAGSNLPLSRPNKRRREDGHSRSYSESPSKLQRTERTASTCSHCSQPSQPMQEGLMEARQVDAQSHPESMAVDTPISQAPEIIAPISQNPSRIIAPGLRHTSLRDMLQYVINEGLKNGGRPDSAMAQETETGEVIEVRSRGSDGSIGSKVIEWSIDHHVPNTLFIDEKDLSKLISCVFLNAIKFTPKSEGRVTIHAKMSHRNRYMVITVSDNGPGIPAAFLPRLFKAFSQENPSLTRSSDGLGLGLMVAKGIARKLGGDLTCTRAETEGLNHGSDFEIKMPLQAGETISRPASPFGSPLPRRAQPVSLPAVDSPHIQPLPPGSTSPRRICRVLHDTISPTPRSFDRPFTPPPAPYDPIHSSHHDPNLREDPLISPPNGSATTDSPPNLSPRTATITKLPSATISTTTTTNLFPTSDSSTTTTTATVIPRPRFRKSVSNPEIDRDLATKFPLTFLVAEDNKINRKLLVSMLAKFGYRDVHEAHDGAEAVRQMAVVRPEGRDIDVVLMDLWMPLMDGYEATERILSMEEKGGEEVKRVGGGSGEDAGKVVGKMRKPTVLAVTADVTDGAVQRAAQVGMKGFMTKPYKLVDLQRLIEEYCTHHHQR